MGRHARMLDPVAWQTGARCRDADPALFFATDGEPRLVREEREAAAKAICSDCPVARECLDWAMRTRERVGIWGGTTEDERVRMRRAARRTQREPVEVA